MLTNEELDLAKQVKAQWGSKEDAMEVIAHYRSKAQPTQASTPAPSKPIFQDTRADEGIIEQWLKAIPRGLADTVQFGLWGAEQTARGFLNVAGRLGSSAGKAVRSWLESAWVDVPTVQWLKPWEPMKENVFSNTIGAAKEATYWDKSFSEAYKEANKADVERYGNQWVWWDLLDIGTGIRKAGVAVAAPVATGVFSTVANAPWVQYAPQALNAAMMAPVNYADRKLDLGMNEWTKENIAFNLGMWLTKPFAQTKIWNATGLTQYHKANDAVMSPIVKPVQQARKVALEKGWQVIDQTKQGTRNMIDESLIGIDKSKRAAYETNPYLGGENGYVKQLTKEMESPEWIADIKDTVTRHVWTLADEVSTKAQQARTALTEDAPIYKAIKQMPVQVEATPIVSSFESAIRQKWLDIVDGNVVRPEWSAGGKITTSDIGKINQVYRDMLADSKKGYLTAEEMLQSRKNADGKVNWNDPLSTDGANMIKQMRAIIDSKAKEQIPWLKQIDKLHVDQLEKFDKATEWLIQKWGANKWEVRDNIVNILKNLNNSAKSKLSERLSEIMPELSSKIEAINMLPEIYKNLAKSEVEWWRAGNKIAGATVGWTIAATLWPLAIPIGSLIWFFAGNAIGKSIANAKIKRIIQIVDSLTPERQNALKSIIEKTQQWEALTKEQVRLKEEIMSKVQEETVRGKVFPKEKNLLLEAPKQWNLPTPVDIQGKIVPNEWWKILAKPSDKEIITQSKQELKQNSYGSNSRNNSSSPNMVSPKQSRVTPKKTKISPNK